MLCDFLYTSELIAANPMPLVGRPKAAKTLPRSLAQPAVGALIDTVTADRGSPRRTDWYERDLALILTALLAGLRADELRRADVGDIRHLARRRCGHSVQGKGSKDRAVPIEADLLAVIDDYLDSRARRFPPHSNRRQTGPFPMASECAAVRRPDGNGSPAAPSSRACGALPARGPRRPAGPGALVHGLRHTYATELANSEVSVYTLMKLLGHDRWRPRNAMSPAPHAKPAPPPRRTRSTAIIRDRLHQPEKRDGDSDL